MDVLQIYQCFCEKTRLRIVHLLLGGPMCVCHLQAALEEPQVKISRHLAYLKDRQMVEAERSGHWMIYRIPAKPPSLLRLHLTCLQDGVSEEKVFQADLARWKLLRRELDVQSACSARQPLIQA